MLLDRTQRPWIRATLVAFAILTGAYVAYDYLLAGPPTGGTWPGLLFGLAALAVMIFEALLSARKMVPTWQLGRASTWLRAHIWLGLLTIPLVLYHSAFRIGGPVEIALWIVFIAIIATGVVGFYLQQTIPRAMMIRVPMETIYEQIPAVCMKIRDASDSLVEDLAGPLPEGVKEVDENEPKKGGKRKKKKGPEIDENSQKSFKRFYVEVVRPFLDVRFQRSHVLAQQARAERHFEQMRKRLDPALAEPLEQLATYCEERRQLAVQVRLHHLLHGWLLVHQPLTYALLALGVAHAVLATYY